MNFGTDHPRKGRQKPGGARPRRMDGRETPAAAAASLIRARPQGHVYYHYTARPGIVKNLTKIF